MASLGQGEVWGRGSSLISACHHLQQCVIPACGDAAWLLSPICPVVERTCTSFHGCIRWCRCPSFVCLTLPFSCRRSLVSFVLSILKKNTNLHCQEPILALLIRAVQMHTSDTKNQALPSSPGCCSSVWDKRGVKDVEELMEREGIWFHVIIFYFRDKS